ncbi:MAG: thioredoxin domain-containing protein [Deltaproteobacteria bacterium]|nr:thioredoxin domain-containing protein [Deltaproteobacteria bacterium]
MRRRTIRCSARRLASASAVALASAFLAASALPGCDRSSETAVTHRARAVPDSLPGAEPFDALLRERLEDELATKAAGYEPRTRHLREDGSPLYTNRLVAESSPYLLQHAHNPVDWHPWSDETFAKARRLNRPVFLSVGYSTCHWCHVMERESFEDPEIAAILNSRFVPIKVDREERPDVDAVYMEVVQLLTGGGGWPMTVVLTPDREPFFGGTYFPARAGDRGSRAGMQEILVALADRYAGDPDAVAGHAKRITQHLRERSRPEPPGDRPGVEALQRTRLVLAQGYDREWGGFGGPPKFPRSHVLELLLRYHRRSRDPDALAEAVDTLDHMARGGIRDHVGGGFHRYSTDREWLVPHFEKMLYDNALLTIAYLDAYQVTGEPRFAAVAREILEYLQREMTSPEGAFYAATDADSEAPDGREVEGWFFTWATAEIEAVVGPDRARLFAKRYGVGPKGNFEGRTILHEAVPLEDVAREVGLTTLEAQLEIEAARAALYEVRAARPAPLRDDKVIAGWNGLAISAFARGARVLRDERFARAAASAADVVLRKMNEPSGLARSYIGGEAKHAAVLEDYAFLIAGLVDLWEATFDPRWLREALALQEDLDRRFWDAEHGGYFATASDGEELLVRTKDAYDGALPSGSSVAVANLLRLYELTTDERHRERAEKTLEVFARALTEHPEASPRMLAALDFSLDTVKEVILVRPDESGSLDPFLDVLARQFLPSSVVVATTESEAVELADIVPLVEGKTARDGRVTAYVCENRVCALPTSDPKVFAEQLANVRPYPE